MPQFNLYNSKTPWKSWVWLNDSQRYANVAYLLGHYANSAAPFMQSYILQR